MTPTLTRAASLNGDGNRLAARCGRSAARPYIALKKTSLYQMKRTRTVSDSKLFFCFVWLDKCIVMWEGRIMFLKGQMMWYFRRRLCVRREQDPLLYASEGRPRSRIKLTSDGLVRLACSTQDPLANNRAPLFMSRGSLKTSLTRIDQICG